MQKILDIAVNKAERDSFINVHFYSFEGTTKKPKVLVTLYTPPKKDEYNPIKWFLPIEQTFLLRNLGEYMHMMSEAIEESSRHALTPEEICPLVVREITGDDDKILDIHPA